jgi:hypothetical protein
LTRNYDEKLFRFSEGYGKNYSIGKATKVQMPK